MNEAAPILVAGLDHSGKTALRAALGSHPNIHLVRHVELWTRLRAWFASGTAGRRRVVEALTSGKAARLGLAREPLQAAARSGDFADLACEIGRQLCAQAGTGRWGLQEALLEFRAADVFDDLPNARVIMLIRDPRTRYAEMRAQGAVGRGGLAAETAAWIASARVGIAGTSAWPHAFLLVRHEALLDDPHVTLEEVCSFIGEPLVPAVLEALPSPTGGPELSERDVAFVQAHAASEMRAYGYPLAPVSRSAGMLPQRLADASRWQLGRLSWRRRTRHLQPSLARE